MQHLVWWSQMDESQRYHLLKKIPQDIKHFFVSLSS
jgi:hypothetical protein